MQLSIEAARKWIAHPDLRFGLGEKDLEVTMFAPYPPTRVCGGCSYFTPAVLSPDGALEDYRRS